MSGKVEREKILSQKVMLSLLMAGTMSVCISGGDVWAEKTVKLNSDTVYNVIDEIPMSIEMNGHNIISNVTFGDGTAKRELLGTGKETLKIVGDNTYQYGIGAFHGEDSKINFSNIKEINISGAWITNDNGSALYTNAKGSINLDHIGLLKIENSEDSGIGIHTMAGEVNLQADSVIVVGKNDILYDRAILAQLSGVQDESNGQNAVVDINANTIDFHTTGITIAAVNWSEPISDNEVKVNLKAKNISIISDSSTGLSSYSYNFYENNDHMTGKTAIILNADETVVIKGARNAVYATNGRKENDAFISIEAGKTICITGNTNALYAGSNALVKINDNGTAKVNLTGNVVAENGGQILVKNAGQTGAIYAASGGDIRFIDAGNIAALSRPVANGSSNYAAIGAEAADISIKAKNVTINSGATAPTSGRIMGIYATKGSDITIDADKIDIDLQSVASDNLSVDRIVAIDNSVNAGKTIALNSNLITINALQEGANSVCQAVRANQGNVDFNGNTKVTVRGDQVSSEVIGVNALGDVGTTATVINFNGDETSIKAEGGARFVMAVEPSGGTVNFTGKKVDITVVNKSREESQSVAIWSQYGANVNASADTDITATVQGNIYANGLYVTDFEKYNGNAKLLGNFTATVISNDSDATGIYGDLSDVVESGTDGIITIGKNLTLDILAEKGEDYGIYGTGKYNKTTVLGDALITAQGDTAVGIGGANAANIAILGNISIETVGKTEAYSVYASSGANVSLGSAGKTVDLNGDVVAKNNGVINIAGKTNTINGIVKAVDGGTVNLNGASDAVYNNISINSFVTKGTSSDGSVKLSGGTMNFGMLNNQNLAANSFVVSGGSLKAASEDIFTNSLTAAGTTAKSGKILDAVDQVVDFNNGKLILTDAKYNMGWLKTAKTALNDADYGTMSLVFTGILVTAGGKEQTEAAADDLAATGAVHAGVTATVTEKDVTIGSGSLENLGAKDLALGGSAADASKITVGNGKALTLVGGGSENDALVKTADGTAKTDVAVLVGNSTNAGTLNLGVAGTASGGNLNAAVVIANDNSKVNVDAGTFKVNEISADKGAISVNEGAALKTESLTVGSEGSTVKLSGTGTLEAQSMTISKGTIEVTGTAKAGNLKVTDSNAKINVGTGDSAGSLVAGNAELHGAAVVLDPVWQGNDTIGQASKAALTFINNSVDGLMTVGRNSVLSLGTDDTAKAETAFSETGLTWGENGVSAALYIDRAQQLAASGGLYIDGNKDAAAAEANKANFAAGSLLIVNGAGIGTSGAAALTGSADSKLTVADGARLYLTSTNAGTYVITDNFTNSSSITGWSADAAKAEVSVNKLSEIEKVEQDAANGKYTVTVKQKDVQKTYDGISLPHILQAMDQSKTEYAGIKYLTELANDTGLSPSEFVAAVNDFARGAESSGTSRSSALAAAEIGNAVQEHLSFANLGGEIPAGLGRGEDQAESGNIWAQYLHNKDKVNDLGGVSYDAQYNGVVIGGDFAPRGKYSSGVAFSYGSGSSTGSASKNEFDFWGLSYYGSVRNADTNLIFDAGYSKTSSEFKGVVKAEPSAQVFTLGIKGEQSYDGGHGTRFVPYAGLRYLHIDADAYTGTIGGSAAARYSPDKADVWLLPLGINISHVSSGADGWLLRPSIDLAYVWALGDRDNLMSVTVPGVDAGDRVGYELMEKGFFAGRLGLEAAKDDWSYGVSYSYQKGSAAQSSKWFVNVQYSF